MVIKVCIVSLKAYDLIVDAKKPRYIGGAEMQQALLGKSLKEKGYKISFITQDFGQSAISHHDEMTIYSAYNSKKGIKGLKFFFPRLFGLWGALKKADADIYHLMGRGYEAGLLAIWCILKKKRFVYAIAADADCLADLYYMPKLYEKKLYVLGLKNADVVVAQTEKQKDDLYTNFKIEAPIISNCTRAPAVDYTHIRSFPKDGNTISVAWVGRFVKVKRIEWFFELAEKLPNINFMVAGWGDEGDGYVRSMIEKGKSISNLKLLGLLSPEKMEEVFRITDFIVCTSIREGLPNVFMEAWARGIPIVSTVDPESAIEKNGLGKCVADVNKMKNVLEELAVSKKVWRKMSDTCLDYYKRNHTVEVTAEQYDHVFQRLI